MAIFSEEVRSYLMKSWKMTPISFHKSSRLYSRISTPSKRIWPAVGSYSRVRSFTIVVFPWPFLPTKAIRSEGSKRKLMLFKTSFELPGYEQETFLNSNPRRIGRGAGRAPGFETILGRTEKNSGKSVRNRA